MTCRSCSRAVPEESRFCPHCGARADAGSFDPTRTSASHPGAVLQAAAAGISSDPSDHGRFLPGTMLGGRYRIVGLLGRGGMGEVYRADDLKLGQAVALKFLPAIVEKDAARLQRFLNEVKIARQISHPNVCRVYDVGEVDGHHYLSMEYVDGEDLASLLRRIGRLPKDKAIQISRQLCAGLAAAHEQGILHRDLKPANVMIDGRGRARITDFGLATLAGAMRADEVGAGTPLYMSPEQRAGKELTARSDLYSLGLVLYELFTGQQAFKASTPTETARLQEASAPMSPTRLVEGLDPTIERAILRCLEKEPRDRPASALAVSASLPGGDPLAAALAAGETPSPEMVAAAGETGGLAANAARASLAGIVLGLAAVLVLAEFTRLESLVHLGKSRQVLEQQARDIAEKLGYRDAPRGRAVGFSTNGEYLKQLRNLSHARYDEALRTGKTPGILFWYRQGPDYLVPWGFWLERASPSDPPRTAPGSVEMLLDPDGRLIALTAVPAGYDDATRSTTSWTELLGAAHLDPGALSPATPAWTPPVYADSRAAWDGSIDGYKVHVEAAAFHGRPTFFAMLWPWEKPPSGTPPATSLLDRVHGLMNVIVTPLVLAIGILLARRNLRLGRGHRRGANRFSLFVFAATFLSWVVGAGHVPAPTELDFFFRTLGRGAVFAGIMWVYYMALEPYLRGRWPNLLTSWVRVLDGRFRDPLVGRDILVGGLFGIGLWIFLAVFFLVSTHLGLSPPAPQGMGPDWQNLSALVGPRETFSLLCWTVQASVRVAIVLSMLLVASRLILRKQALAVAATFVVIAVSFAASPDAVASDLVYSGVFATVVLFVLLRFGILPLAVTLLFYNVLGDFPLTLDLSVWYVGATALALVVLLVLAIYGFVISLGGRPAFGRALIDD